MTWDYTKAAYMEQAKQDKVWHLERLICYGLNGEKLDRETLAENLEKLKIPDQRKDFLALLLWNKKF